jgi:hypothetical protein
LIRTLMQEEADTLLFFYRTGGEQEAILYKEFQSDVEQEMKATGNASLVAVRSELNAEELGNYWGRKWMVKIMQYCQERKIFAVDQLFFNIKLDNNYVTQENFKLELEKAVPDINANDLVRLTVELQDPKQDWFLWINSRLFTVNTIYVRRSQANHEHLRHPGYKRYALLDEDVANKFFDLKKVTILYRLVQLLRERKVDLEKHLAQYNYTPVGCIIARKPMAAAMHSLGLSSEDISVVQLNYALKHSTEPELYDLTDLMNLDRMLKTEGVSFALTDPRWSTQYELITDMVEFVLDSTLSSHRKY